jgi:hypothetical protein
MHDLIDIIRGNARPYFCCRNIEYFSGKPANLSHTLLLLLVQDRDIFLSDKDLL